MIKPGYKTTEFWGSVAAALAAWIATLAGNLPDRWATAASAFAAGLYALSRGLAKRASVVTTAPVTVQHVAPVPPPTTTAPVTRQTTTG